MENNIQERIDNQLGFLKKNRNNLVIDADTHITNLESLPAGLLEKFRSTRNYYHGKPISAEDLLTEMTMAGVDMSLVWQNPAATPYNRDQRNNYEQLLKANLYIAAMAEKYPEQLIPAGWTDPEALGLDYALALTEYCIVELGFPIVKMNPAQNAYPIDREDVMKVVEKIQQLKGIVAFHYGADTPYTPAAGLEKIARSFPATRIIGVHMGGGGAGYVEAEALYQQTRELGLNYKNLFFIQSAKRDTHIESDFIAYTLAGEPYNRQIACASDAPYGRQTWNFGGYRLMFASLVNAENHPDERLRENPELFNTEMVKNYMGRNLADLVISGYENMRIKN
jgi:predicted TIM-barrel fold metal-dependent hydrolase